MELLITNEQKEPTSTWINCVTHSGMNKYFWNTDSNCTDHITSHKHLLYDIKKLPTVHTISMLTCASVNVTYSGKCS